MENRRIFELIRILLQQSDYITISKLAELLLVSNKTIRNDLDTVSDCLKEHNLSLSRKTGVGIRIAGSEEQKLSLLRSITSLCDNLYDYSPRARKIYIGLRLITCTESCRIYELASELYTGRATIHKDIAALSPQFESYKVTLIHKNKNGIRVEGEERHLRDLMFELMQKDQGYPEFLKIIQQPRYQCKGCFIFKALDYTDQDIYKLVQLVIHSGNHYISSLPFHSMAAVLLRIFVNLIRIASEHPIHLSNAFMEDAVNQPLFPEVSHLASILASSYHVIFSEEELRYMQIHFLSLQCPAENTEHGKEDLDELTEALLADWETTLHRPFTQDRELRNSLKAHLSTAITRFRHGIAIANPMMDEIYAYYQNTFNVAKKSLRMLEPQYHCHLSNDEIGYIAIHLAAALDRTKQPLKVILVCHVGTGASRLLLHKLSTQIPEIEIIAEETFLTIQHTDLSEAELIISTLDLTLDTTLPILVINAIISDHDLLRLRNITKKYYKAKNAPIICTKV